jgi:hypothetical protein
MVATTPKPRLVKLAILPQGEEPFKIESPLYARGPIWRIQLANPGFFQSLMVRGGAAVARAFGSTTQRELPRRDLPVSRY